MDNTLLSTKKINLFNNELRDNSVWSGLTESNHLKSSFNIENKDMEDTITNTGTTWTSFPHHKNHLIDSGEYNTESKGSGFDIDEDKVMQKLRTECILQVMNNMDKDDMGNKYSVSLNTVIPLDNMTDLLLIDTSDVESFHKLLGKGILDNGKKLNVHVYKGLSGCSFDVTKNFIQRLINSPITQDNVNAVNHPTHYNNYSIEVIDMMEKIYGVEKLMVFCELNAFKYRLRAGTKNSLEEDLAKEKWYLDKLKELKSKL